MAIAVRSADGQRIAHYSTGGKEEYRQDPSVIVGSGLGASGVHGPLPDIVVEVSEPRESALASIYGLRYELVEVGIVALLASAIFGALMAWRIARPIQRLTHAVVRVGESTNLEDDLIVPPASGEVGRLLDSFRDMMRRLRHAQDRAIEQSRLALLGEVAANVAHEVRTPLSVMKASAQLLARDATPPAEKKRLAELVASEVERLNSVVSDLVSIGKPVRLRYEVEPLVPIVERAIALCEAAGVGAGISIEKAVEDAKIRVRCSANELYQVVLNLIRNAIQAIGRNGKIVVRIKKEASSVVIEVDDSGPGFPPDLLAKAFSPFVTTKHDGAGLGLAIARRVIEDHRGSITAANLPGNGARLTVQLPAETREE
jgi:signal transduction histidine kinase